MRSRILIIAILITIFVSCSPAYEVVMPFRNWGYSVDRLFPVKNSSSDFTFRIWFSNSTSVYRVISISRDSTFNFSKGRVVPEDSSFKYSCYLTEIGNLRKGKKFNQYFNQIEIEPKSGFKEFKNKIDRLNLTSISSQELLPLKGHEPISTYAIEVTINKQFNSFKFDSRYPDNSPFEEKYAAIEKLIFDEFNIKQYFKFPK